MNGKLIIDFGLVVLIWMVQLVVYPAFKYFEPTNLLAWHQNYTKLITIIVMPLMLGQLGLHIYSVYNAANILNIVGLVLVISVWAMTFFWAVPLHNQIDQGHNLPNTIQSLVNANWPRTIVWTIVFVVTWMNR